MTKGEEKDIDGSTWNKIPDDEPIFILRAQDKLAPALIYAWAHLAIDHGASADKYAEATLLANQMNQWPKRKWPD
jgi:hypothetical protein